MCNIFHTAQGSRFGGFRICRVLFTHIYQTYQINIIRNHSPEECRSKVKYSTKVEYRNNVQREIHTSLVCLDAYEVQISGFTPLVSHSIPGGALQSFAPTLIKHAWSRQSRSSGLLENFQAGVS